MSSRLTHERADELKSELEAFDPEVVLLDGLTAVDSLTRLVKEPKAFEAVVVFSGQDYARRQRDNQAQYSLFE